MIKIIRMIFLKSNNGKISLHNNYVYLHFLQLEHFTYITVGYIAAIVIYS